jgi:membrane-associated phospholipid phosphatase
MNLDSILESSIPLILWLQSLGEGFASFMKIFTFMGYENFYLILFPIVYWWVDEKLGFRAGIILLLSGCINTYFKWIFHLPRPYWIDTSVGAKAPETSFGAPSGHAQNAVAVWGLIATSLKKPWSWVIAIFLIFMIGFSRLVLGAHFLLDVILGWLIGIILLWVFLKLEKPFGNWAVTKSLTIKIGITFAASLALILVGALIRSAFQTWELPSLWVENAAALAPDDPIAPLALSGVISNAAILFGLGAGFVIMNSLGGFTTKGTASQQIIKYIIGILGVLIIWMGLDFIFPEGETVVAFIFRYIRYGLAGLWISLGAPWIYVKAKLSQPAQR